MEKLTPENRNSIRETIVVFSKDTGNANNYRVPSLCYLGSDTVIAIADERFFGGGDNPNRIDKVIRISTDNGHTWGKQITIVEERGASKLKSSSAIDPSSLFDYSTGTLHLLYSHTPAGVGILNCKRTTGYLNGNKILIAKGKKYEIRNNEIFYKDRPISITVDGNGNVSTGGNYKDGTSLFKEVPTSYLMITNSINGGLSWDKPTCINPIIKSERWGFIGACPGSGIKLSRGPNKGRLVFPIYYGLKTFPLNLTFSCIYSDDGGKNWSLGQPPIIRGRFPQKNPKIVLPKSWLSETQLAELENGDILAFIRNHNSKKRVMCARSCDGGYSFGNTYFLDEIPQPICQISALSFVHKGRPLIALLNANSENKRENGTLRISSDQGETFPYSKLIIEGEFAYSSMAQLGDGTLGILYEDSLKHENIKFIRIDPKDLLEQD